MGSYETPLGCKPKALCMARPKDSGGEYCPSHSVCPKECQWDEIQCSDGIDSRGCKNEDLCISRKKDKYGNLCQAMCPPKCTDSEFFCPGTVQSDGCRGQPLCVEKKLDINGIVCPEICPKACSDRELRVHHGSDPRGCLIEDTCEENDCYSFDIDFLADSDNHCISSESAQECQHACYHDEWCTEFTWISNANDLDQNCCLIHSRPEGKETTVTGFVSGPKECDHEGHDHPPAVHDHDHEHDIEHDHDHDHEHDHDHDHDHEHDHEHDHDHDHDHDHEHPVEPD